jgi:CRP-like cAMP-binding protein
MRIGGGIMQKTEKRERQRISSKNLLNYISLDHNYQEVSQGMGKTINMSETGLLIETPTAINPEHFLSLNIGLANERFKVHGQVIYTTSLKANGYRTGIRFNQAPKAGYNIFQHVLSALRNGTKLGTNASNPSSVLATPPILKGPKSDYLYVVDEENYLYGEKIVTQGNFGNWVWVVLDGSATIVRETPNGDYPIFKLGPGAFIGSSMAYLLTHHARTTSVIAADTIQLGLLDTQRMTAEHSALSPEFKGILKSLSGQLKRLIDRIVLLRQGVTYSKEDLLKGKTIFDSEHNSFGLYNIERGKATTLHRNVSAEVPLVNLYPGDFIGLLPFLGKEFGSDITVVRASTTLEKSELNSTKLLKEYEALPQTLKNMIEFTALKLYTGSTIIAQMAAEKSQIN